MRILLAGTALLAGLGVVPALAADWTGFYAGFYGGESVRTDSNVDATFVLGGFAPGSPYEYPTGIDNYRDKVDPLAFQLLNTILHEFPGADDGEAFAASGHGTIGYAPGNTFGGVFGYSFGNGVRIESDFSSTIFEANSVQFFDGVQQLIEGGIDNVDGHWTWGVVDQDVNGGSPPLSLGDAVYLTSEAQFLLANVWFDIDNPSGFTPYIGGGVGVAQIMSALYGGPDYAIGRTISPAAQVGTGVRIDVNDNVALDMGYRYKVAAADAGVATTFETIGDEFEGFGFDETGPVTVQTVQAGLTFRLK